MRRVVTLLLLLGLVASGQEAPPTREEFLAAVAAFEANPLNPSVDRQLEVMVEYTRQSKDILIGFSPVNFPVAGEKETPDEVKAFLMGAFCGGNGREQLRLGKKGDQSYAGVRLMLKAYRALQARVKLKSPGMEKLAQLEVQGKLKMHLEKAP